MTKLIAHSLKITMLMGIFITLSLSELLGLLENISNAVAQSSQTIPEANDFATLVLRDPWDMDQFFDVSQHINGDGQFNLVQNIQVENSIFSAQSTSARDAYFFVLFPGFYDTIGAGKTGVRYPVRSDQYHCLYIAMKVDSKAADSWGPDQLQVFWFLDGSMNTGRAPWGASPGIQIYPEAGFNTPKSYWKLFSIDLASINPITGSRWNDQPIWRGLRVDPTLQADVNFAVDWVRLTDCKSSTFEFTWSPKSGNYAAWVRPEGTTRDIRVTLNVDGVLGRYSLDTQGLPPGSYRVGLGSNTDCCTVWSSSNLVINQTPVAQFVRPSFTSGPSYNSHGNASWEFSENSDITKVLNTDATIQNGVLDLVTDTGPLPGGKDAQVYLNTPQPFNGNRYRYLNFTHYTEGPWQRFGGGMVIRWIWTTPGASGRSGYECHLVSQDIPYDVGWQTFTVDLFDPYGGSVEQKNGDCPSGSLSWAGSKNIYKLRFDPNENIMGYSLHEQYDWISLNQVDSVVKDLPFPVQVSFNKSPREIKKIAFYYTDDINQPKKYPAESYMEPTFTNAVLETPTSQSEYAQFEADFRIFLPLTVRNYVNLYFLPISNGVNFGWSTGSVPPGEYHICVDVEDAYNQATYCSEAAVQVISP